MIHQMDKQSECFDEVNGSSLHRRLGAHSRGARPTTVPLPAKQSGRVGSRARSAIPLLTRLRCMILAHADISSRCRTLHFSFRHFEDFVLIWACTRSRAAVDDRERNTNAALHEWREGRGTSD